MGIFGDGSGIGNFDFGTEASFSCSPGFSLIGNVIRLCVGDGSSSVGMFEGDSPTCKREC